MPPLLTFRVLLLLMFRVSFRALKISSNPTKTFYEWSVDKERLSYLINRAVFKYIALEVKSGNFKEQSVLNHQVALEAISSIFSEHLRQRLTVIRLISWCGLNKRKWFVLLSLLFITTSTLCKLIIASLRIGKAYSLNPDCLHNNTIIAVGFPSHAFTLNNKIPTVATFYEDIYSSFGEYLYRSNRVGKLPTVISCDEYLRNSKKLECEPNKTLMCHDSISRLHARLRFHLLAYIADLFMSISWVIRNISFFQKSPLVFIEAYKQYLRSLKWRRLLSQFKSNGIGVNGIYIGLFSFDLGDLRFDKNYRDKITTYSYSENILIPPSAVACGNYKSTTKPHDYLRSLPLQAFTLTGNSIGCTESFELVERAKCSLLPNISRDNLFEFDNGLTRNPCVMGYEELVGDINPYAGKTIAVFDVPPESNEVQIKRALLGDKTCDLEFISAYLGEISQAVNQTNARLIFKPKYSLSNYDSNYRSCISKMKHLLGDRFILLSPYVKLFDIFRYSDVCLSFPYTTTKTIADYCKIKSFYFVPADYRCAFESVVNEGQIIIGVNNLIDVFRKSERNY